MINIANRLARYSQTRLHAVLLLLVLVVSDSVFAKGTYQTGPEFIAEVFGPAAPSTKSLWLTPEIKKIASGIAQHAIRGIRVRYWQAGDKTAWILDELGKELPITTGIVIESGRITQVKILTYRESRGGEVRFPAFLAQFVGGMIDEERRLDRGIDGITGATISVRAITKTARLALFYHQLATASTASTLSA